MLIIFSCTNQGETEVIEKKNVEAYVVAGHAYGSATYYTNTIYPKFIAAFNKYKQQQEVSGLFLTGDVVAHPRPSQWDSTKIQLDELGVPWYIAPGNHDITHHFIQNIQPTPYLKVDHDDFLFLVLNTTREGWTIDSAQVEFVKKELETADEYQAVFVFSHQLWWQEATPEGINLDSVRTNSYALFEGEYTFWDTAWPLFENLEKEVYFFAGDLGCDPVIHGYYEDHYKNFHFYGSGMGGGLEDNFLIIELYEDRSVEIRRVDF